MRIDITARRFDEEIRKLGALSEDELFEELKENALLRGYFGETCAPGYARDARWYEKSDVFPARFKGWFLYWTRKEWEKFNRGDDDALRYWGPKIREVLGWYNDWPEVRDWWAEAADAISREKIERVAQFMYHVPEIYQSATLADFQTPMGKSIIKGILEDGESYLLYGGRGVGKSHLCWALGISMAEEGTECRVYDARVFFASLSGIARQSSKSVPELIDEQLSKHPKVLIIDEADKLDKDGTEMKMLSLLVSRRCEEMRQTVLACNSDNEEMLSGILGESIIDRFRSAKWKAHVVGLGNNGKRPRDAALQAAKEEKDG